MKKGRANDSAFPFFLLFGVGSLFLESPYTCVDTVAFIDPKRSLIDIVKATGRALRKADWKERGYIFIPVVVDEVSDPEDLIESLNFDTVWKVLQAMVNQDQRLEDTATAK